MLNVKCFHCGKSFALDTAVAAAWLQEQGEKHPKHYPAQCHFCRRVVKVPVKELLRHLPAAEEPGSTPQEP
jgi:phage terminase large subunit GpA-like protein